MLYVEWLLELAFRCHLRLSTDELPLLLIPTRKDKT